MAPEKTSTRDKLLETAGKLFAEHGFKGTSIKMIADETGQNIAAVNYHFGSKQNLLMSTLKFVLEKIMTPVPVSTAGSRTTMLAELNRFILDRCQFLLSNEAPIWYGKLIVRAGFELPFADSQSGLEFYKPDFDYLENLALRIRPDLKSNQARLWAYSVVGQIFFYVFGRDMILLANDQNAFAAKNIVKIAGHIGEMSASWLQDGSATTEKKAATKKTVLSTLNKAKSVKIKK